MCPDNTLTISHKTSRCSPMRGISNSHDGFRQGFQIHLGREGDLWRWKWSVATARADS